MNIQGIIVLILFLGAVFYIGRSIYLSLKSKKSCSSGCKKCGVDVSDVELKKD